MSSAIDPKFAPPTLGALLRLAWNAFRTRIFDAVGAAGFDDLQPMHVGLFRYPTIAGLRPGQLAAEAGLSKQSVNDMLRQLEALGYLQLEADPDDRRARRIALTRRGTRLMETVRAASQEIAADWMRLVGARRYDAVRDSLLECIAAERARAAGPE